MRNSYVAFTCSLVLHKTDDHCLSSLPLFSPAECYRVPSLPPAHDHLFDLTTTTIGETAGEDSDHRGSDEENVATSSRRGSSGRRKAAKVPRFTVRPTPSAPAVTKTTTSTTPPPLPDDAIDISSDCMNCLCEVSHHILSPCLVSCASLCCVLFSFVTRAVRRRTKAFTARKADRKTSAEPESK